MILRVKALLRRAKIVNERKIIIGQVTLNYDTLTVSRASERITLPQKEFMLLYKLLSYPDTIFTRIRMSEEQMAQFNKMTEEKSDDEIIAMFSEMLKEHLMNTGELDTYESNCEKLGIVDHANPSSISLYPKDFASKEKIVDMIKDYNKTYEDAGHDDYIIRYTDIVGLMTSGISSMINIVSYVLIAFVAISLIVSSIMIAIITYISVLEHTKKIGILRSIGASKNNITRVFNAETIIEGLVAGALGVGITLLLNLPINSIIKSLTQKLYVTTRLSAMSVAAEAYDKYPIIKKFNGDERYRGTFVDQYMFNPFLFHDIENELDSFIIIL